MMRRIVCQQIFYGQVINSWQIAGKYQPADITIFVHRGHDSRDRSQIVIAIDDHMLSLVKDVKELRVTRAWRSRCGNALALIANNGRFTAMAEAMGPIVVIDQQGKQVWAESGGRRRMVTAMTFLQEPTLTQGSWHLAVADRNANTIEVVTGRCKLNSTSSDNELTIVSTVKQSSHGIRIGSFLLGAHCGADQKAVLMVHNDGYIVDLKL